MCLPFTLHLHPDLHPHAASLPLHDASQSGDAAFPRDDSPQGEANGDDHQQSRRVFHPQTGFVHPVPQAQQVSIMRRYQTG